MNATIRCGGVVVNPGDVVVADEEGVVVVPRAQATDVLAKVQARVATDSAMTLEAWEKRHRAAVEAALSAKGYRLS
jgi:regulator of RNase E activity RraA